MFRAHRFEKIVENTPKNIILLFKNLGLTILVESSDGHASSMHNALQLVASLQYKVPVSLLHISLLPSCTPHREEGGAARTVVCGWVGLYR